LPDSAFDNTRGAEAVALYYLLAIHETAVNCRVLG